MSLDFVKTYAQLIRLSPEAPPDKFYSTDDYRKLQTLGPSLPALPYPLPVDQGTVTDESTTTLKLKSIRPPYKFSVELAMVSASLSIYKVKCQLIEEVEVLRVAAVKPSNLKFMARSKILTDTTTVGMLGDHVSITVMVSNPASQDVTSVASEAAGLEPELPRVVSNQTWDQIEALLVPDLGREKAKSAVAKWKATTL